MRVLHTVQQHAAFCLTESRTLLALAALFAVGLVSHQLRAEPLPYDEAYYVADAAAPSERVPVQRASLIAEGPVAVPDSSRREQEEEPQGAAEVEPGGAPSAGAGEPTRMNLNQASARLLTRLPGIGPKKAAAVVAYRDEHGPFPTVEALQQVRGIGPKTVAKLAPYLFVETAAASDRLASN
jgi:competence protein ComEA